MSTATPTIRIEHVPDSDPAAFTVAEGTTTITGADGRALLAVTIPAPDAMPITEDSKRTLSGEVRWYLEKYLQWPFSPNDERAERAMEVLRDWGRDAFRALFDRDVAGGILADIVAGHVHPAIDVVSNDPRVLAWPWEALCHPTLGFLAHHARITRSLAEAPALHNVPPELPEDRINILLVTARPKEEDIDYRSVSRPLVDLIAQKNLPAAVHLLRPPTLDELRTHLRENPHTYHVLHFDGHGGFGRLPSADRDDVFRAPTGKLLFEKEDGSGHDVSAETLSRVLREHEIPAVVLNACQSATIDARAENAFASVVAGLVQAGVRSVVAMGYSLYVSSARRFLPSFYERLFEEGDLAEAVRAGRQGMETSKERLSAAGPIRFEDWLVPVHYHQAPLRLAFEDDGTARHLVGEDEEAADVALPEEGEERGQTHYGFFGRDAAILEVERVMRRTPAGVLVHGLGGVGKTSLAWELLTWLKRTGGLTLPPLWFNFDEVRSAEYLLDQIGVRLYGDEFRTVTADLDTDDADARRRARLNRKVELLVEPLRDHPFMIVWDNFESATGIEGAAVDPLLKSEDRQVLKSLLTKLRGGETTVLLTSRSTEDGLPRRICYKKHLGGLQGEERWRLTRAILQDLGMTRLQENDTLNELVDELRGHPLALQALLLQLASHSPETLLSRLGSEIDALDRDEDEMTTRLFATLRFVEDAIPDDLRELLIPLSMHERFVDADYLVAMSDVHGGSFDRDDVDRLLSILTTAGLVQPRGANIYSVHPMLTSYLRSTVDTETDVHDAWTQAFVTVMATVADDLALRPLHEQRGPFAVYGTNFTRALDAAERRAEDLEDPDEMLQASAALAQSLGAFAQNTRQFDRAKTLFEQLTDIREQRGDEEGVAAAYHQLGRIAEEQRELAEAKRWYEKAVEVFEKRDDEHRAATGYHQLGIIAQEQRELEEAKTWYEKSLEIEERQGNEHGAAQTYHNLGAIAQEQRELEEAKTWYEKSREIFERLDDEHGAAQTYGQLGILAALQNEFVEAGRWLIRAIVTFHEVGDDHGVRQGVSNFLHAFRQAPPEVREEMRAMWGEAGLPEEALDEALEAEGDSGAAS